MLPYNGGKVNLNNTQTCPDNFSKKDLTNANSFDIMIRHLRYGAIAKW